MTLGTSIKFIITIACLLVFSAARVELTPAEVDEGGGFITACAVYSGFESSTELFMSTIGFTSANPAEKYGKVMQIYILCLFHSRSGGKKESQKLMEKIHENLHFNVNFKHESTKTCFHV